jgi:transcriptional regulator with XRE-family HTH domain
VLERGTLRRLAGPSDPDVDRVAGRLRRWREDAGLTLQSLARRSGVAASTIQKIETRQMVPTVAVLLKVCRGLDRPPGDLFQEGAEPVETVLLPASERGVLGGRRGITAEHLAGTLHDPTLDVWRLELEPGRGSGDEGIALDGEECLLVETGELEVRVGEQEFHLRAGDALHYKAHLPHAWSNGSDAPVRFLLLSARARGLPGPLRERFPESGSDAD